MSEPPNKVPDEVDLEFESDGHEIYERLATTLRPFVVRRKVGGPLTVLGHAVEGPYRGKSGREYYSIVIHDEEGDIASGTFRADQVDGIEEGPAPQNGAS
jgi:hypothetical protein